MNDDRSAELLVFMIDDQRFGIPATQAREVLRAVAITPLPGAPRVVEGVIDVRGNVVPVLDLRARFGLASSAVRPSEHLLVAWTGQRIVALRVSQVLDLASVAHVSVQDATALAAGVQHIAGIARMPDGLVLIHDLAGFLAQEESEHLDRALVQRTVK